MTSIKRNSFKSQFLSIRPNSVNNISIFLRNSTCSFGKNNKVFNIPYIMKQWARYDMGNDMQYLDLIFSGISSSRNSSLSSKILTGKTRSHVSVWF